MRFDSPKFQKWFAGSQVAYPDGSPLVVYHSSPDKFTTFDTSKEGAHFGTWDQASNLRKAGKRQPVGYVLSIKNPLRLHDVGVWNRFNNFHYAVYMADAITKEQADAAWEAWQRSDNEGWEAVKQALKQNGYDGIVYENEQEGPGDSYIAFWHNQIMRVPKTMESIYRVSRRLINEILDSGEFPEPPRGPSPQRMGWKPVDFGQETSKPVQIKTKSPVSRFDLMPPVNQPPMRYLSNQDLEALMQRIKDEEALPPHKQNAARIAGLKRQAIEMMRRLESLKRQADKLLPSLEG